MTRSAADAPVELTDILVRMLTVPDGKSEHFWRDAKQPGLAVRGRKGGGKSYIFFCTRPGQKGTFRVTIGSCRKFTVAGARKQAAILAGHRAQAIDLIASRRENKEAAKRAERQVVRSRRATLGALIGEGGSYETSLTGRGVVNAATALSALRRHLLPDHAAADIASLTLLDVTTAMDKLVNAGKPGAASDLRKHTSVFLNWAQSKGHVSHNVLAGFRQPKETRAQKLARKAKGRTLTDDEIKKVWHAAAKLGAFGLLVRLCLLGGPRRSEPTMIEWSRHIMDDRVTFDAAWTKMGLHHDVPRTALIDQVLDDARRFQRATTDLMFPGQRGTPISGFTKLVAKLIEQAVVARFTMHDLRRSLRTIMSRCGYDNDIQRLCVGQKLKGIDAVYNKDEQWVIRKMAFEAAHDYIAAVIKGGATSDIVRQQRAANPQNKRKAQLLDRLREHHAAVE